MSVTQEKDKCATIRQANMFRSERFQRLGKEFTWIVLGQAMAVLGSLVGVRLLTELLDPAAYGELALGNDSGHPG